jgi:hypothetical protein
MVGWLQMCSANPASDGPLMREHSLLHEHRQTGALIVAASVTCAVAQLR